MKYVVILGDGMADWPLDELGGKTPLDVAKHPYMDKLAQNGRFGLVQTVPEGMKPGSDTANLSVFGYDPRRYYSGRSPLEAASLGIALAETDVTYRCNLVTLSQESELEQSTMLDYSAGEISTEEAHELILFLDRMLSNEKARLYPGFSYRHCLVLNEAETGATLTPPHDFTGKPVMGRLPDGQNAMLLREWMEKAYTRLKEHPVNRARVAAGKSPANAIWFWGEGRKPALTPFYEKTGLRGAVISAVDLIQGIGRCAEMEVVKVEGTTGTYETNFAGKARAAIRALSSGADYVYVHIEAPDECGHHGQIRGKIYSIEQIDSQILAPVWAYLETSGEDYTILVLPDHPTPIEIRTHSSDPVPFAIYRKGNAAGSTLRYTERDAKSTGVRVQEGYRLIDEMRKTRN
ncbi:MAG: cofactor-independent phosphoglycerate mutase [Eubacteriales bacterium]|nr:cofactor-independent phosphoglycerate mutase [Eubacteriales bacterium]